MKKLLIILILLLCSNVYCQDNKHYKAAAELLKNKKFETAEALLETALEDEPENIEILSAAAYCAEELKKNDEATEFYKRILIASLFQKKYDERRVDKAYKKVKDEDKNWIIIWESAKRINEEVDDERKDEAVKKLVEVMNIKTNKDIFIFNGHRYKIFNGHFTWLEAMQKCKDLGGHLVYVESKEEYEFLIQLRKDNRLWVGGIFHNGSWLWLNKKQININWHPGKPDNDMYEDAIYVQFGTSNGDLFTNVINEFSKIDGFICEWE